MRKTNRLLLAMLIVALTALPSNAGNHPKKRTIVKPVATLQKVDASADLRAKIEKAVAGLEWISEGEDTPRLFFLRAAMAEANRSKNKRLCRTTEAEETDESEDDQEWQSAGRRLPTLCDLKVWAKTLPVTYRPQGYTDIESQTVDELLEDALNPEPDKHGEIDKDEAEAAVRWTVLKDLLKDLSHVEAFWLGSEINYQVIVVCGRDKSGNLVGFWMRHWSS